MYLLIGMIGIGFGLLSLGCSACFVVLFLTGRERRIAGVTLQQYLYASVGFALVATVLVRIARPALIE